jgi:hypothetical protein
LRCALAIDEGKLKVLAPFAGTRAQFCERAGQEPLWVAVFEFWNQAFDAELVQGGPPLTSRMREQKRRPRQKSRLTFNGSWDVERRTALDMAEEAGQIRAELAQVIERHGKKAERRALVTAEASWLCALGANAFPAIATTWPVASTTACPATLTSLAETFPPTTFFASVHMRA